ncbi:alpha/beta hydrolase, partial [bacterium]|nr:alpha/beta hydrolase [bacterium]
MSRLQMYYTPAQGSAKGSILFIPGMWCQPSIWKLWAWWSALAGWQSWVVELKLKFGNNSINHYVQLVEEAMDQIKHRYDVVPVLVGHSMGGLIVQKIASRQQVPAIVLVSSAAPMGICNLRWPIIRRFWRYLPQILFGRLFKPSDQDLMALEFHRFG